MDTLMSSSSNWKNAERRLRDIYLKYDIPAERISRAGNFSKSDYDVRLTDPSLPIEFANDSKYSEAKPYRHHGLLKTIVKKYCKEKGQQPVLFTCNYKENGGVFAVPGYMWSGLLAHFLGYLTKEEVLLRWSKERKFVDPEEKE